jgi:phosphoribosylamine-glycine ligase
MGKELDEAINKSRELIEQVEFENKYFRRDIGFEFFTSDQTTAE